jgi:hypothetical protein
MTTLLTKDQYAATFSPKMTDVTNTEFTSINIWPYVEELMNDKAVDELTFNEQLVEQVYRNEAATYDHVLLPTKNKNAFVIIIVDLVNNVVSGHYNLNLNEEYGIT